MTAQAGTSPGARQVADSTGPEAVISVSGLVKRYGEIEAVRGIDFAVRRGETFGFLGPNGAGKSTTIKILCTLATATAGTAMVAGHDSATQRDAVRQQHRPGVPGHDARHLPHRRAEPALPRGTVRGPQGRGDAAHAPGHGHGGSVGPARTAWSARSPAACSGGWRSPAGSCTRRACCSWTSRRSGSTRRPGPSIWTYINDLKSREDITIFLTTHYMDEAEHCDRIAIIDHGKIVAIDTPEALKASIGKDRVQIQTADNQAAIAELADRNSGSTRPSTRARSRSRWPRASSSCRSCSAGFSLPDPVGQRVPAVTGRRVHVLHRHDDPRRRGVGAGRVHAAAWRALPRKAIAMATQTTEPGSRHRTRAWSTRSGSRFPSGACAMTCAPSASSGGGS